VPDPVFLITGASGGIGAATARAAARAGYRVALSGRRPGPLRDLAAELGGPPRALAAGCDVSDWDQLLALVSEVLGTLGRLDVVFANAGRSAPTSFLGDGGLPPPSGTGWWPRTCSGPR
jgi:NAD(P)-dependent dehydrogenase (short-subunit alcohol dehydrogenase family)